MARSCYAIFTAEILPACNLTHPKGFNKTGPMLRTYIEQALDAAPKLHATLPATIESNR